jgi:hypothetical protein
MHQAVVHFPLAWLEAMTRLLALLSQLLLFAATGLLVAIPGSLVSFCLSERIQPRRPNRNASDNRLNTNTFDELF